MRPEPRPPSSRRLRAVAAGVVATAIALVLLADVAVLLAHSPARPVAAAPLDRSAVPTSTVPVTTPASVTTTTTAPPPTTTSTPPTVPVPPTAPTTTVPPLRSITVGIGEGVAADVHLPAGHGPYPVVLYVHGGGWISGDRTELPPDLALRDVLDHGWALVSIDYRWAGHDGLTATDQVGDINTALSWIRGPGRELGLGDHLVGIGHSAGAHLLSLVAATAPPEIRPAEVILVAGIYDFGPDVVDHPLLHYAARAALGCPPEDCPRRPSLEPANFAEPGDPPVTIVHGAGDPLVDPITAHRYGHALHTAGVAVSLHAVEGAGHLDDVLGAATRAVLHSRLG